MRIAWTGPIGEGGGVPGMGRILVEELVQRGVEVDVYVAYVGGELPPLDGAGRLRLIIQRTPWRWGRWYSRTGPRAFFSSTVIRTLAMALLQIRLLIAHRRRPYDAVYQLSTTELFLLGWFKGLAPPIVVHPCVHAAGELHWHRAESAYALASEGRISHYAVRAMLTLRARLQGRALERADLVLGLSERFNELVHRDYGVPFEKLRVVRTPVDVSRFTAAGSDGAARPRTILYISRISVRKGVAEMVELSHRLDDLAGEVEMLLIGGPTQWSNYTAHMAELNPRTARYVGGVPSGELPELMRAATLFVAPSRYEPGSIATVEALACGLPVVLSDEVGAGELVDGPHARFHRACDVDGLEVAVRELLDASRSDGPELRDSAAANAKRFSPAAVAEDLIAALTAIAGAAEPTDGLTATVRPVRNTALEQAPAPAGTDA